eukprot:1194721-Prorocentrum_minimum.AAC.1
MNPPRTQGEDGVSSGPSRHHAPFVLSDEIETEAAAPLASSHSGVTVAHCISSGTPPSEGFGDGFGEERSDSKNSSAMAAMSYKASVTAAVRQMMHQATHAGDNVRRLDKTAQSAPTPSPDRRTASEGVVVKGLDDEHVRSAPPVHREGKEPVDVIGDNVGDDA